MLAQLGGLRTDLLAGILAGLLIGFLAGALVMSRRRAGALLVLGSLGVALAGAPQGAWAADTQPRSAAPRPRCRPAPS